MSNPESPLVGIPTRSFVIPGRSEVVRGVFNAYISSLRASGGEAVMLAPGAVGALHRLDALLLVGGEDLAAADWWSSGAPVSPVDPERDNYEALLVHRARVLGIPTLGLCRGAQVVNCVLGGTVARLDPVGVAFHSNPNPSNSVTHRIRIEPETRLASVLDHRVETRVVSRHAMIISDLGVGLVASAWATDGSIEAVESSDWPFLGVQWHPEWSTEDVSPDRSLFNWLIDEAKQRTQK